MIKMSKTTSLMLLMGALCFVAGASAASSNYTLYSDLAYATVSATQKLDIYVPQTGEGPFPVIISIHGGAFRFGDKRSPEIRDALKGIAQGYAVVGVNYRLSGEAKSPALVYDVKAAVRYIRSVAKTYNLNPFKIASWGGSAGGHLASILGTSGGVKELTDLSLGNAHFPDHVQATVDWFGPIDFIRMDEQWIALGVTDGEAHNSSDSNESFLMGGPLPEHVADCALINPANYIDKFDPPFFIQHGLVDRTIPYLQSVNFAKKLTSILGEDKVSFELLEGAQHGGPQFSTEENVAKVFAFLNRVLRHQPPQ
eukprot:Colp12_sorted_trinity150504_noHs@24912